MVHHTVAPISDTHTHGVSVVHGMSSRRPMEPSQWLIGPTFGSSRYCHSTPMTPTPRTNGAKNTARKNVRPAKLRLSSSARSSGRPTSSGTEKTVKIAVAFIDFQKSLYTVE